MSRCFITVALLALSWLATGASNGYAAPCLIVTLTGTQGGPQSFNGLAGAGTLVRYGDDADECGAVKLQFDAGRGTNSPFEKGPTDNGSLATTSVCGFAGPGSIGPRLHGRSARFDASCRASRQRIERVVHRQQSVEGETGVRVDRCDTDRSFPGARGRALRLLAR